MVSRPPTIIPLSIDKTIVYYLDGYGVEPPQLTHPLVHNSCSYGAGDGYGVDPLNHH